MEQRLAPSIRHCKNYGIKCRLEVDSDDADVANDGRLFQARRQRRMIDRLTFKRYLDLKMPQDGSVLQNITVFVPVEIW